MARSKKLSQQEIDKNLPTEDIKIVESLMQ
jgi:hypothetical protein